MSAVLDAPAAIEPGWHYGLSMAEYAAIPAISASGLELLRRSPAHFRHAQLNPPEPTDAMRLGTALHMALLEPHKFGNSYIALDRCDATKRNGERCTNQAIALRAAGQFCGVHDPERGQPSIGGIEVISAEMLDRIYGMKAAVLSHPDARQLFEGRGASEVTGVWRDPETGVLCKIRLDREVGRAHIHADVKTCTDASVDGFTRQIIRMGYHRRAAFYRRGMEVLGKPAIGSVLIAVEKDRPHGCQTFLLDDSDLDAIQPEIDRLLGLYAECLESGEWPAYPSGLRYVKMPSWATAPASEEPYSGENDDE